MLIAELLTLWIVARLAARLARLPWRDAELFPWRCSQRSMRIAAGALLPLYTAEMLLAWKGTMAIPGCFRDQAVPTGTFLNPSFELSLLWIPLVLAQTVALLAVASALRERGLDRGDKLLFATVAGAMALLSLGVPALNSADVLVYRLIGELGKAAYIPQDGPLVHAGVRYVYPCNHKFTPTAYGPLFTLYAQGVDRISDDPARSVYVFRILGAAWLGLFFATLRALHPPPATLALLVLNPVLPYQFIANAHNDLIAVCLVLLAFLAARRSTALAIACVAAAGLIKLPFAIVGALAFTAMRSLRGRLAASGVAVALAFAGSYAFAGPAYFAGLAWLSTMFYSYMTSLNTYAREALQILGLAGIAAAVLAQRFWSTIAFVLLMLAGAVVQPWYTIWPLAYSLRERRGTTAFLATLPIIAVISDGIVHQDARLWLFIVAGLILARHFFASINTKPSGAETADGRAATSPRQTTRGRETQTGSP